jgi:circadian clock protein KaiC
MYLVYGEAGTGKTTVGLQFLMAGAAQGKRCLGITLLQTLAELKEIITSHGWNTDGLILTELPTEVRNAASVGQTVFEPAEVELSEVADAVIAAIETHEPDCLFIDSLSELSVLVDTGYQLRRQLLRLKQRLDSLSCTTILSAGRSGDLDKGMLETLVHGVIGLEMRVPDFGRPRRRVLLTKMRGMDFQAGHHDGDILTGGFRVYPRISPGQERQPANEVVLSGNQELDTLLGGGLEEGTACVVTGTSGAGKSSLVTLYTHSAAKRGIRSAVFCFDERLSTLFRRSRALGMPLEELVETGSITLNQVNVGEVSPGQLGARVREAVETDGVKIVILDSLSGYLQSMPGERELVTQLHELLGYLSGAGVLTLMVIATHGLFGEVDTPVDVSYIADTVILLRHFEARGEIRRCLAVLKKRYGHHERTIRELQLSGSGIEIGDPLTSFSGVLTGLPRFEGEAGELLRGAQTTSE